MEKIKEVIEEKCILEKLINAHEKLATHGKCEFITNNSGLVIEITGLLGDTLIPEDIYFPITLATTFIIKILESIDEESMRKEHITINVGNLTKDVYDYILLPFLPSNDAEKRRMLLRRFGVVIFDATGGEVPCQTKEQIIELSEVMCDYYLGCYRPGNVETKVGLCTYLRHKEDDTDLAMVREGITRLQKEIRKGKDEIDLIELCK